MHEIFCKECQTKLYELEERRERSKFLRADFYHLPLITSQVDILSFDFELQEGAESGETTLHYACRQCGKEGCIQVWGGGQLNMEHEIK